MQVATILGDVFLAVGFALAAVAFVLWHLQRRWVRGAGHAVGEVIDVIERRRPVTNTVPVIRFRTGSGREIIFRATVGSRPQAHRRGDRVAIVYDRIAPARAMIDTTTVVMLLPIIFAMMAVPFVLAGAVLGVLAAR